MASAGCSGTQGLLAIDPVFGCYMACNETVVQGSRGENDTGNGLGLSREHYGARLSVLEEFLTGAMSVGTYTARIGMLSGQLHARVFYFSNESMNERWA